MITKEALQFLNDLIANNNYKFPPMIWNLEQFKGWEATKHLEDRGKKQRKFIEI